MNAARPTWRQVFDKVERAVGRPLEEAVASPTYVDVVVLGIKAERLAAAVVGRVVGGAVGSVLRAVNIPTRDDVLRLNRQLAVLAAEVRTLGAAQQETRAAARPPRLPRARPVTSGRTAQHGGEDG